MAEAVFHSQTGNLPDSPTPVHPLISRIDSAGTGAYHTLEPPDSRTMATLRKHGVNGYEHGARQVEEEDFVEFDYVFAMDVNNLRDLERMRERVKKRGEKDVAWLGLYGEFGGRGGKGQDGDALGTGERVADPYYGGNNGFEKVFEQVERFGEAFLEELQSRKKSEE